MKKKLTIFITIDVEDKRFSIPTQITGEGLKETNGIYKIMELIEKYNMQGNFFLNVYEHMNYSEGVLENIAKSIFKRGHEVDLHCHPNKNLEFYNKQINEYSLEEQINILRYGRNKLYEWIGEYPIAFRAGAYRINDSTIKALYKIGIPIDSSRFYCHKRNEFNEEFTINKIKQYHNIIEVPVTYVKKVKGQRELHRKFDIDFIKTYENLIKIIHLSKEHDLKTLTFFLHSFSFMKRKVKKSTDAPNSLALLRSETKGDTYVEIMGEDKDKINKFDRLLDFISKDYEIEVLTFRQWYNKVKPFGRYGEQDFIPII